MVAQYGRGAGMIQEVSAQLIEHFGDKVFRTVIPRNVRLAEAPSFGKPVLFHDKESRGALAYLALAGEMIRREEAVAAPPAAAAEPQAVAAAAASEAAAEIMAGNAPIEGASEMAAPAAATPAEIGEETSPKPADEPPTPV